MSDLIFITGNQNKADYLATWLGHPVEHQKLNLDEIQSLDLREVTEHKVRQAYALVKRPVIVEDASLTLLAMGKLPGTFVKWFLEELGNEGLICMADAYGDRRAVGRLLYAYYDGSDLQFFEGTMEGLIATEQRGTGGFGFDKVFINDGYEVTRAEMNEDDYAATSYRAKAILRMKSFLEARNSIVLDNEL